MNNREQDRNWMNFGGGSQPMERPTTASQTNAQVRQLEEQLKNERKHQKKLADEFRVKAHLASMDAKDYWHETIEPQLQDLDRQLDEKTKELHLDEEVKKVADQIKEFLGGLDKK